MDLNGAVGSERGAIVGFCGLLLLGWWNKSEQSNVNWDYFMRYG